VVTTPAGEARRAAGCLPRRAFASGTDSASVPPREARVATATADPDEGGRHSSRGLRRKAARRAFLTRSPVSSVDSRRMGAKALIDGVDLGGARSASSRAPATSRSLFLRYALRTERVRDSRPRSASAGEGLAARERQEAVARERVALPLSFTPGPRPNAGRVSHRFMKKVPGSICAPMRKARSGSRVQMAAVSP